MRGVSPGLVLLAVAVSACGSGHRAASNVSHDFGTIRTRLGPAHIQCGGEVGPACGLATRLEFASCTPAINSYINFAVRPPDPVKATDAATRALVENMPPPSGNTWMMGCPGSLRITNAR
jgi:hypothetical protein